MLDQLTQSQASVLAAVAKIGSAGMEDLTARCPALPLADLRAAVRHLASRRYLRDLRPGSAPCWRITYAGRHLLEQTVRAAPRGCPPPSPSSPSPEQSA